jgi:hypothetical protein
MLIKGAECNDKHFLWDKDGGRGLGVCRKPEKMEKLTRINMAKFISMRNVVLYSKHVAFFMDMPRLSLFPISSYFSSVRWGIF